MAKEAAARDKRGTPDERLVVSTMQALATKLAEKTGTSVLPARAVTNGTDKE
jgi:hypothetical protein